MLSVIVPVYNRRRYLRACVQSLLNDMICDEILVVDDGSTDGSLDCVEDLPVKYFSWRDRRGQAFARNFGVEKATGKYITFLDSDDKCVVGGLKRRLDFLEGARESIVMGALSHCIDENDQPIESISKGLREGFRKWPSRLTRNAISDGWLPPAVLPLLIMERQIYLDTSLDTSLSFAEDRDFIFRLLEKREIPFQDIPCVEHRLHQTNTSFLKDGGLRREALAATFLVDVAHSMPWVSDFLDS